MPRTLARLLPVILLVLPAALVAQASAYIPLDDTDLPLLEHLIARGDVEDPSPMLRPFRAADAERVLALADTAGAPNRALIARLSAQFEPAATPAWWRGTARGGFQAYTHGRRDELHPAGDGGVQPYADVTLSAGFGSL